MNIEKIKKLIISYKNKKIKIKVNIGRNKSEYYEGFIDRIYQNIFTVNTNKGLKSYTYSDVATKTVKLMNF